MGYLLAAARPMLLGALHDWRFGWAIPLLITAAIAVLGSIVGMLAGRDIHLEPASWKNRETRGVGEQLGPYVGGKRNHLSISHAEGYALSGTFQHPAQSGVPEQNCDCTARIKETSP